MHHNKNKNLCLIILFALISVSLCQTILKSPVHTAVIVGDDARFNYSADPGSTDAVKWAYYKEGTSQENMYNSLHGIDPSYTTEIEIVDEETDQHDLIILNVETTDAGKYYAGFALSNQKVEPQLVVLSELQCLPDPPGSTVADKQIITFECIVTYHGYKKPTLRWRDNDGNTVTSYLEEDDVTQTLTLKANMTADWTYDLHEHSCHLNFELEEGETGGEPPTFEHNCTTHFRVTYHTNIIEMAPNPDSGPLQMQEGEHINCTGNGNPEPTYTWYCSNGAVRTGGQLEMSGNLIQGDVMNICNCTAVNTISGITAGYFKTVSFYAYGNSDSGDVSGVNAGVITLAVLLPLVVIGAAVGVGIFFYLRKKNKPEKPQSAFETTMYSQVNKSRTPSQSSHHVVHSPSNVQPSHRSVNPASVEPAKREPEQQQPAEKGRSGFADLGVKGLSGSVPDRTTQE